MGGYGDALALEQQEQLDQQQAAANSRLYNADGSAKANDFTPPKLPESAFPPSVAGGTELSVNTDQLQTIATQMHGDLAQLQATLQTLTTAGPSASCSAAAGRPRRRWGATRATRTGESRSSTRT